MVFIAWIRLQSSSAMKNTRLYVDGTHTTQKTVGVMRMETPKYDWHDYILDIAKTGETYGDIYRKLVELSAINGMPIPCRHTMESYLRSHKSEWNESGSHMRQYRRYALRAAKELCYPSSYIERIKNATTENQISRIMREARVNAY